MVIEPVPVVRLQGRAGQLRCVLAEGPPGVPVGQPAPPRAEASAVGAPVGSAALGGHAGDAEAVALRWLWEGTVDGPGLAALLQAVMVHGAVPCDVDGRPHRARAIACWYDAGHGTTVVELKGRPEPMA